MHMLCSICGADELFINGVCRECWRADDEQRARRRGLYVKEYVQEEGAGMKPTNPKDAIGGDKIPYHLWPETATILGCLAMLEGALKYGRANWRPGGCKLSIYYDAARRHWNKIMEGEWMDPDSGIPHIGHVLACGAIVADAHAQGNLDMDCNYPGGYVKLIEEMTPHVKRMKEKYADKHPHHWTSKDVKSE